MEVYSVDKIIRALEKDGWYRVKSGKGHAQFKHPSKPGKVTISVHGKGKGHEISGRLLDSIEAQSGLDFSQIFGR